MHLRQIVGVALLFAAVPLQMCLMKYRQELRQLVSTIGSGLPDVLREKSVDFIGYVRHSANEYLQSVYNYLGAYGSLTPSDDDDNDDDDREVENHLIRNFRPPHLEFRVGDVVLTRNMIVGAIVGWQIDKSDLTKEPEYFLLVQHYETYITEKQMYMIQLENIEVNNDKLKEYFKQFDGIRYVPKKWVQKMYPKD